MDDRAIIYSLGAVGYFLLTGWPPFRKATALQLLIAHVHDPVTPITEVRPEVPDDLQRVILKCLEKDRERRFQDVSALDHALAGCQSGNTWTQEQAADWWQHHEVTQVDDP